MNKREIQKQERIQTILTTSLTMFVTRGYEGTTIRDIAKETGMSLGLLFHYFDSKETLYLELLHFASKGVEFTKQMQFDNKTPLTILTEICTTILQSFKDTPENAKYMLLVKQALSSQHLTPEMKKIIQNMNSIETTVPLISAGQNLGEIKEGDPLALSMAFFSCIQGVAESAAIFQNLPLPEVTWIIDIIKKH